MSQTPAQWYSENQRYLMAAVALVRSRALEQDSAPAAAELEAAHAALSAPSALEELCACFGLSAFERDLLLLCAATELDGNSRKLQPTFGLALATLESPHWSALSPASPLRRWHLLEIGSGSTLTSSPLRIDERVLHHLTGLVYLDERLRPYLELLPAARDLAPSHQAGAVQIERVFSAAQETSDWPLVELCGNDPAAKRQVAAAACRNLGLRLHSLRGSDVPAAVSDRDHLARLWEREALLGRSALLLDLEDLESTEIRRAPVPFLEALRGPLIVVSREPVPVRHRPAVRIDVNRPPAAEQHLLWKQALGPVAPEVEGSLKSVVSQFSFGLEAIQAAGDEVRRLDANGDSAEALWEICRRRSRARLDDLAHRIEPAAGWNDLVLPQPQKGTLWEIAAHVRHRFQVYEVWGFAGKGPRGLGISALFAGPSGTGKTMAAEVLARHLKLDLYRIDLSAVVSKYIGETEKNLRQIFDAAEESGAILLFDEADALFGKRSEVKDSHDRYANIEVGYLLQRMEGYRGLAILTTNMKNALDAAFLRRIRFVVQFPFPDAEQREQIWRRIFPARTPADQLDTGKLARLTVAGGSIRNIALNAAFLAAEEGSPVRMQHLLQAACTEYQKLEKTMGDAETGGWC